MNARIWITVISLLSPLGAAAEFGPLGDEFQINTHTLSVQDDAGVAAGADTPTQALESRPGTPSSPLVGTSGKICDR